MAISNFSHINPYAYPYYNYEPPNSIQDEIPPDTTDINLLSSYPISSDESGEDIDKTSYALPNAHSNKRKLQQSTKARKWLKPTFTFIQVNTEQYVNSEKPETQEQNLGLKPSNNLSAPKKAVLNNKKFRHNKTNIKKTLLHILTLQNTLYPNPILQEKIIENNKNWSLLKINIPFLFYNISKEYVRGFLKLSAIYSDLKIANRNARQTGNHIHLNSLKLKKLDKADLNGFNNELQDISSNASVKRLNILSNLHVYLFPSSNLNSEISKIKSTDTASQALTVMAKELEEEVNKIKVGITSLLNGKPINLPVLIAQDSATDSFIEEVFPHNFPFFMTDQKPSNSSQVQNQGTKNKKVASLKTKKSKQAQVDQASKDLHNVVAMIIKMHDDVFPLINKKKPKDLADLQRMAENITKEVHSLRQANQEFNQCILEQENQILRQHLAAQSSSYLFNSPYGTI